MEEQIAWGAFRASIRSFDKLQSMAAENIGPPYQLASWDTQAECSESISAAHPNVQIWANQEGQVSPQGWVTVMRPITTFGDPASNLGAVTTPLCGRQSPRSHHHDHRRHDRYHDHHHDRQNCKY